MMISYVAPALIARDCNNLAQILAARSSILLPTGNTW
jgi:hypothetical protein